MFDHVEAFHRPRSIPEAVRLLRLKGRGARVVAGGTDVIVQADREIRALVDITGLGLDYIRKNGDGWAIGATATMSSVANSAAMRAFAAGIIAAAAATCGSVQLRNMATVGGNLANASPAADLAIPLLALDATAVAAGERGRRGMPLADFFTGPGKTSLDGRLLVEVLIPLPPRGRTGWSFQKLGRTEVDISLVSLAAGLQLDAKGRVKFARIAMGAVGPMPLRARAAEQTLAGHALDENLIGAAAAAAAREAQPISDLRASAEYRRDMCGALTARALRECARQAGCSL
ncbi:MAG: xanthine dehydrogenase family protein subunit M [Acidobacteriia bacterium]|nr:xanthine dehydrogenase family protein subunit M [Terriglobia bacterium]